MTTPQDPFSSNQPAGGPGPEPGQGAGPGYGQPPPSYGAPDAGYGPPPGYGAPPPAYGSPPAYGAPGAGSPFGQPGGPQLAGWGDRAVAFLIDYFGPALLAGVVSQFSQSLGSLLVLAAVAWGAYNGYLQGSTGQSTGKKVAGTKLLREQDGQLLGGGLGVGRFFLHILDSLPCYLGFLWPIWDDKKQTFADKLVKSVVIKA